MADDKAAFGVFPQMKPKRSKQDPEAAKNVPVDLARGALSGVLGAPGDIESLIRMLPYLSEETILPTSEDIEKRLPFRSDTPVSKAATGMGQLAGGFYTGRGSPLRAIGAIPAALKHGSQEFALAAGQSGPRIFIGPNAKTFDGNRAMRAVAMEKKGFDPVEIWRETGTFKGADGIWRQEISDQGAKFLSDEERALRIAENKLKIDQLKQQIAPTKQKDLFPKSLTEAKKEARQEIGLLKGENVMRGMNPRTTGINSEYIFEHPELYKAYPELRTVNVNTETGGNYRGALNIIPPSGQMPGVMEVDISRTGMKGNPTSTLLHEMQHAVQTIEGMHPGGSPTYAFSDPITTEIYKRRLADLHRPATFEEFQRANRFPEDKAQEAYDEYVKTYKPFISPAIDREVQREAAQEYYKRLAGEAEARAVQERAIETDAENRMAYPFSSYDVLPDDLIVKPPREFKEGGVIVSNDPDVMRRELQEKHFNKGGKSNKDEMRATPVKNEPALGVSKAVQKVHEFLSKPFGYQNPPGQMLSEFVGLPAVAKTLERVGYGEPLTTGAGGIGGTTRPRGEVIDAALAVAPLAPATKGMPVGMVIKPKGGNWLTGDVESKVGKMKMADTIPPEKIAENQQAIDTAKRIMGNDPVAQRAISQMENEMAVNKRNNAINDWIDRNLTNYIKKEMATPEDPVRKLAEQGITHKSDLGDFRTTAGTTVQRKREQAGFPAEGMGQSDLAKQWENLTDYSFSSRPAKDVSDKRYPWVSKLDPETPVYGGYHGVGNRELGFDHIVDVLRQDVREGRIRPEQLSKVSMEQAVRRTYEYDQEMAKKMREAQIKATEGMPVHKEYPEGYRWIELALPEAKLGEGYRLVKDEPSVSNWKVVPHPDGDGYALRADNGQYALGSSSYAERKWNTPDQAKAEIPNYAEIQEVDPDEAYKVFDPSGNVIAKAKTEKGALNQLDAEERTKVLENALKYEGETMGHCVGGYCPDVLSGRSRIYSLRDAKGEPHVTIEVQPNMKGMSPSEFYHSREIPPSLLEKINQAEASGALDDIGSLDDFVMASPEYQTYLKTAKPPNIVQIKGKQNRAPKEEYLPYVQDFVKGGQWSDVGDLQNTGLIPIDPASDLAKTLKTKGLPVPQYVASNELTDLLKQAEVGSYTNPTKGETFINPNHPDWLEPPAEGMKRGGVAISDNPDTMMMELEDQHFQAGGISKGLKGLFSKVNEVAKDLTRTKGTGAEFMKEVEKTKGVKPAEIQHRKLDEIKAMPKMTKEEFIAELEKRPPANLQETVLGQPSKEVVEKKAEELAEYEAKQYAKRYAESWGEEDYLFKEERARLLDDEMSRLREDARFELTQGATGESKFPKYGEYTLPGGENYREILLQYTPYGDGTPLGNKVRALGYKGDLNDLSPRQLIDLGADKKLVDDWTNAINTYQSSHYKQPNVIAHARVSDRVTPDGERVLHIEEIQSDWHQAGRKKGYQVKDPIAEEYEKLDKKIFGGGNYTPEEEARFYQLQEQGYDNKRVSGVPDAPFKKNWHELMMNRILADAAEKGYDRVVITPGAQQAERYDLSRHLNEINYGKNSDGTFSLTAVDKTGRPALNEPSLSESQLESLVGKDLAQKIVSGEGNNFPVGSVSEGKKSLSGLDLQVGGEGMKGFYDKMLPDYLNSLGKKYGVQVEAMPIRTREAGDKWVQGRDNPFVVSQDIDEPFEGMVDLQMKMPDGTVQDIGRMTRQEADIKMSDILAEQEPKTSLHSFKITPEMRQEFTEKGFPMYSIAAPVGIGATQMQEPVQITDNPDAMMLEVEDQKFGVGGVAKGIVERLTRAPAKTKKEVEAIAERIAPQVTGEFVREAKGTQSVAGKTQKQFAREKELPVVLKEDRLMPEKRTISPEELKGMVVTGVPGDPTITGKSLVRVGDIKLDSPSPQHGGPLYGLGRDDDIFWASGIDPAGRVQSVAKEAMQAYDAPVVGQYIMMGPDSINYAQHFADANLSAIDLSKMNKRQIEEFNKIIRFGNAESGPRPSFPGIENKEDAYLHLAFDPALRKHFNSLMQMPTVTQRFNLPSGQDIRFAVTEAPLRDLETGVTGFSMGQLAPDVPKSALPLSMHPTYSHDIPGRFMGGFKYPTPYELTFPDTLKSVREHPRQSLAEFGSLKYVGPRQIYDQQMIDELMMYQEAMKRLTGKKEGGEVKLAGGGAMGKAALEALSRLKGMKGEFAQKSAEQARYLKDTAHMDSKTMPTFEEWQAKQINITPQNIEQLKKETGNKSGGLIKVKRKAKA